MIELGADRAATEWLLKCGAQIKFKNHATFFNDFNHMPKMKSYQIEEVNAEKSCISSRGFDYFGNY